MKSWYAWCGVGAIVDLDEGWPASTRAEALDVFRRRYTTDSRDWSLWERDGPTAMLLGIVHGSAADGTRVFQLIDPERL